jgi:ketosteroid isomerase-like protein
VTDTFPARTAERLLAAFSAADLDGMRSLLAADLTAYITNSEGGLDRVDGREEYLGRVAAMNLPAAEFTVEPTQAPVVLDQDRVLIMVEIRAARGGRSLHNFAAHLLELVEGVVSRWWMVDAKPAESDAFWR